MAQDLATLGIRVENNGAMTAIKQTGAALDEMGVKGERAASKIVASTSPLTQAVKRQSEAYQGATIDLRAAEAAYDKLIGKTSGVTDATRKMTLLQMEAIAMNEKMSASVNASSASLTANGANIGRLRQSLASLVSQMTGIPPIIGRIASTIGVMTAGMSEVVLAMAAIGAAVWVWDKLTEGTRNYRKAIDELVTSLGEERRAAYDATAAGLSLITMRAELERQAAYNTPTGLKRFLLNPNPGDEKARQLAADAAVAQARDNETQFYTDKLDREAKAREEAEKKRLAAEKRAAAERERVFNEMLRAREQANKESNDRIAEYNKNLEEIIDSGSWVKVWKDDFDQATKYAIKDIDAAGTALVEHIKKQSEGSTASVRHMLEEVQKDFATFFTDIFTKGIKSFADLFSTIRDMFLRLVAEMAAAKIMSKIGVGALASLFPALAQGQSGIGGGMSPDQVAAELARQSTRGQIMGTAGAAIGGGLIGYGLGSSTGSGAIGALGGAASGATMGAAFGPVGMAVGALAGLAGGLLGAGAAAKRAREQMKELQSQLADSFDALRAKVNGDTTAQALAQNDSELKKFLLQINAALPGKANEAERNKERADATSLYGQLADQIKKDAERQKAQAAEDLGVRLLAAQGRDKEAAALALQLKQQREMQDAIAAHTDPATLALLAQVQAQEKLKAATDQASTSALNMVEGYKVQAAIFGAIGGRSGGLFPPSIPIGDPLSLPSQGVPRIPVPNGGNRSGDTTINIVLDGKVVAQTTLKNLQNTAQSQFGDSTLWTDVQRVS